MSVSTESIQEALRTYQRGDVTPALQKLMALLIEEPDNYELQYYLGVVATSAREYELAERQFLSVRDAGGDSAAVWFGLGQVSWGRDDFDEAEKRLVRALELQRAYPEAYALLGATRLAKRELEGAEEALGKALSYDPDLGAARANLANVQIARGQERQAEETLKEAIRRDLSAEQAYANYLTLVKKRGALDEAVQFLESLMAQYPEHAHPVAYRAQVAIWNGNHDQAVSLLEKALALDGSRVLTHAALAVLFMGEGRAVEALPVLSTALERFPKDARLNGLMGTALGQLGRRHPARRHFERALAAAPDSIEARSMLIPHFISDNDLEGAERLVDEILERSPDNASVHVHRANIRDRQGRAGEAAEILEALMDAGNVSSEVVSSYITLRHTEPERVERAVSAALRFLEGNERDHNRRTVRFALAKTLERSKRYEEAFQQFDAANESKEVSYDREATEDSFAALKRVFSSGFQQRLPAGHTSGEPVVFICGMPRSGTTLTEQVLASHSSMTGGGELLVVPDLVQLLPRVLGDGRIYPDYVPTLDQEQMTDIGAEYLDAASATVGAPGRFTDKLPQNFLNLGFIDRILPGSKIIHCRRNPMDTCLSIFGIDFFGAHPYAYSQADLGHYYSLYLDLMEHWRSVGIEMLEVRYEDTVADLERSARRMLDFIGLEWEPGLLDFHKTGREVATASYQQVRQPLYKTSLERWRRYEEQLQPLYGILGDATRAYMAEVGD